MGSDSERKRNLPDKVDGRGPRIPYTHRKGGQQPKERTPYRRRKTGSKGGQLPSMGSSACLIMKGVDVGAAETEGWEKRGQILLLRENLYSKELARMSEVRCIEGEKNKIRTGLRCVIRLAEGDLLREGVGQK